MSTEQQHHFFAVTALNWAVGQTRAEAIGRLARDIGATTLKKQAIYCCSWKVLAPQSATYKISFFQPQGVTLEDKMEFNIVDVKGRLVVID